MTPAPKPGFLLLITLSVVLALLAPSLGIAQATAGRTVVLSLGSDEDVVQAQHIADLVEAGLSARGVPLVSMHDARDRIQAQSRPPMTPDSSDLDLLAREARAAIEHVAFGRSAAAQRSVEEVFKRAERALESLNRETKTARNVLDACLALVRNTLARGDRQNALEEAMRCRRLVPDVAPSEFSHPASVIGVLAEADNQLRRMRIGQLVVQSTPESGCSTYVNGRHLGVTPFRLDRAAEGEYRVQVECSRAPGRVHLVHLGEKPVELTVDIELDHALHSEGRVTLAYAGVQQARRLAKQHGVEVARSVRAEETVLVSVVGDDAVLSRLSVSQSAVLGRSRVSRADAQNGESQQLGRAIECLLEGRMDEVPDTLVTEGQTAPRTSVREPPSTTTGETQPNSARTTTKTRRVRRMRGAAAALAAVGAGLLVAGVAFEHQRARADEKLGNLVPGEDDEAIGAAQDDYDRGEKLRWLGAGGGALLGASVPLLRVDVAHGVPWWSYVIGAAGVGLATWGAVELARNGGCEEQLTGGGCAKQRESAGKGGLLLSGAFPMLMLPIDHLIEWRLRARSAQPRRAD